MNLLPKFLRFAVLTALVALAAPSADAGLRDALENARDTAKCASKTVFRSLETFARGFKIGEPGGMSEREYGREANKSRKEAMEECLAASENIMARSFGVEKVAAKARKVAAKARKWAASAKSAADEVSKWFDGKKMPQEDGRMALSVGDDEREFYKRETGVLGDEPLPAAKPSPLDEDIQRLLEEKRRLDEQEAAWEAGAREDTPTSEARADRLDRTGVATDVWRERPEPRALKAKGVVGRSIGIKNFRPKRAGWIPGRLCANVRSGKVKPRDRGKVRGANTTRSARTLGGIAPEHQDVGSRWTGEGERVGQGSGESARQDDADSRGDYTSALDPCWVHGLRVGTEAALEMEARWKSDRDSGRPLRRMEAERRATRMRRAERRRGQERQRTRRSKALGNATFARPGFRRRRASARGSECSSRGSGEKQLCSSANPRPPPS